MKIEIIGGVGTGVGMDVSFINEKIAVKVIGLILQYPMTLCQGPKIPVMPTLL